MQHLDLSTDQTKFRAVSYSPPTLVDVNGDGKLEVVFGTSVVRQGGAVLMALVEPGTLLNRARLGVLQSGQGAPGGVSLPHLSLLPPLLAGPRPHQPRPAPQPSSNSPRQGFLYVLNAVTGGALEGWPVQMGPILGAVVADDINDDGKLELVATDTLGNVAAFDGTGKEVWERHLESAISQVGRDGREVWGGG